MKSTREIQQSGGVIHVEAIVRHSEEPNTILADLPGCAQTIRVSDPESSAMLDALVTRLQLVGVARESSEFTASSYALLTEASRIVPQPARITRSSDPDGIRTRLPAPSAELGATLDDALALRRSVRTFGKLDAQSLSSLLYHAGRIRDQSFPNGVSETFRASPSAGARHPIDIIVVPTCRDMISKDWEANADAYWFDPGTCELVALAPDQCLLLEGVDEQAERLLGRCPPVTLVFAARVERTLSRYPGGLTLVYRDAGALTSVLALVGAALNLSMCPLATPTGGIRSFEGWIEVGGIAVGGQVLGIEE
jgi:SagB-type dehydrogenase family enzyme